MSTFEHQIEDLMAGYRQQLEKSNELRRKISEIAASVTAPRQVVKVTVGAHGDLRAVDFPTGAYKRMTPAELAEALMTTIDQAKDKAQAAYADLMNPQMPGGLNILDLVKGKVNFSALLPPEPQAADAVQDYLTTGQPRQV